MPVDDRREASDFPSTTRPTGGPVNDMSTPEMLHRCPVNSYTEWDPSKR